MQPDTFFFPPTKAEHANVVFTILGRALALAVRFESGCRALSSLIHLKEDPSPLDSEESLRAFSDRLARTQLVQLTRISPTISLRTFLCSKCSIRLGLHETRLFMSTRLGLSTGPTMKASGTTNSERYGKRFS